MLTREELARLGLKVLAVQQRYFRDRTTANLEASKALEREFRHECQRVVEGETLFPEDD